MYLLTVILPRPTFRSLRQIPAASRISPAVVVASTGPSNESIGARILRWIADRDRLAELDDRILLDIGLTRRDVARGTAFDRDELQLRAALLRSPHLTSADRSAGLRRTCPGRDRA